MNITEFLIHEPESFTLCDDVYLEYRVGIHKVEKNPFYIPFGEKTVNHWEITIEPFAAYIEDGKFSQDDFNSMSSPWRFKLTSHVSTKPTIEIFSKHIYDECWATIKAMELCKIKFLSDCECFHVTRREHIHPKQVYNFIKLIHKNYSKTEDFLNNYDVFVERIYHNLKFLYAITDGQNGMYLQSYDVPLGRHFLNFLGIEIYTANLEKNETFSHNVRLI